MRIDDFQKNAEETNELQNLLGDRYVAIWGLVGEVGGIASVFKKKVLYHKTNKEFFERELCEEIGDALWYLANIATLNNFQLSEVAQLNLKRLSARFTVPPPSQSEFDGLTFDGYRIFARRSDRSDGETQILLLLVKQVGKLLSVFQLLRSNPEKSRDPSYQEDLKKELGDVLWFLALLGDKNGLNLDDIASRNVSKSKALHSIGDNHPFDAGLHPDEQLPRKIAVDFSQREIGATMRVTIKIDQTIIGDKLSDNSHTPDDYRFHDVFHLAYMANLGWSPVIRDLLKRKRRGNAQTDENEDGARAKIIEEAISLLIFNQATKHLKYFEGAEHIDLHLLAVVQNMCSGLEVKKRTAKQWERAILSGYEMWRQLRANGGGRIKLDLDNSLISYEKLP